MFESLHYLVSGPFKSCTRRVPWRALAFPVWTFSKALNSSPIVGLVAYIIYESMPKSKTNGPFGIIFMFLNLKFKNNKNKKNIFFFSQSKVFEIYFKKQPNQTWFYCFCVRKKIEQKKKKYQIVSKGIFANHISGYFCSKILKYFAFQW